MFTLTSFEPQYAQLTKLTFTAQNFSHGGFVGAATPPL